MEGLQPGDPGSVGGYRLVGRLGAGGMGQVYLGVSPGGRKVAVKLIHPVHAGSAQFRERFAREIEAARRVGGFHTAPVVDADPRADPPWMVTAFIDGPSLEEAVGRDGPLAADRVRALGAGLAEGLAAIHAQGLVHRDLKPGNVVLAADGPRIIDFGIARAVDATGLTSAGVVVGTFAYMSPEQVRGDAVGPASDVFSLGCVLAFAATGRSAFGADAAAAVMFRIVSQPPDLDGLADLGLRGLIAGCLAKSPLDRPAVPALLAALARPGSLPTAVAGRGAVSAGAWDARTRTHPPARAAGPTGPGAGAPGPAGTAPPAGALHARRSDRRPAALIAAVAALAVLAALVPVLLTRAARSPSAAGHSPSTDPGASSQATDRTTSHPRTTPSNSSSSSTTRPRTGGQIAVHDLTLHAPGNVLIFGVAFSPDGKLLATGDDTSGHADLWDVATGKLTATLADPQNGSSGAVAFSPDGTLLATANGGSGADLWDVASGRLVTTLADPRGYVYGVAFSPDGKLLVTADGNTHAYIWDLATYKRIATLKDPGAGGLSGATFSPDGKLLVTADGNGSAYVWNVATRTLIATLADPGGRGVNGAPVSPDGTLVATADDDAHAYLWDVADGKLAATLTNPGQRAAVRGIAFSPDGKLLVTADDNRHTYIWNVATDQLLATFTDPSGAQDLSVAFSPDGTLLAIGDENGDIYIRGVSQLIS